MRYPPRCAGAERPVPDDLREWFCDPAPTFQHRVGGGRRRTDVYLFLGEIELSIKSRGGKKELEVKGLVAVLPRQFHFGQVSVVSQLLCKWSSREVELANLPAVETAKIRRLRKFDTAAVDPHEIALGAGDFGEDPIVKNERPDIGCNVELTSVTMPWKDYLRTLSYGEVYVRSNHWHSNLSWRLANHMGLSQKKEARLCLGEVAAYRRDGFIVPSFSLDDRELYMLQSLTRQLVADNPGILGIRRPHLDKNGRTQSVGAPLAWLKVASSALILDALEQLIGPNIILWTSTLFYKPPQAEATRWHRDGRYYPITPLATTTAWISVFDSEKANSALCIIPGSHIWRRVELENPHNQDGYLDLNDNEKRAAINIELKAGQMVLFDVSTIHGSSPNLSSRARAGYAIRFFPATSHYDRTVTQGVLRDQHLFLVRGRDKGENFQRLMPG